jgi:hypothetical protein
VVFLAPLVALRRTTWTFGAAPLDLDDDRFLRAFVSAVVIALIPETVDGLTELLD